MWKSFLIMIIAPHCAEIVCFPCKGVEPWGESRIVEVGPRPIPGAGRTKSSYVGAHRRAPEPEWGTVGNKKGAFNPERTPCT